MAGSTAVACINDHESSSQEREFRSAYLRENGLLANEADDAGSRFLDEKWLYAAGAAMLAGSLAFCVRREKDRSKSCDGNGRDLS